MSARISLVDAAALGVSRIRMPSWSHRHDHFEIDIKNGKLGPTILLWSPPNRRFYKRDPISLPTNRILPDKRMFVPYRGPDGVPFKEAAK